MKRPISWSDEDEDSSSDESSSSHSDTDTDKTKGGESKASQENKGKKSQGKLGKRKSGAVDFDALKRHGYRGGLSVLSVPQPKDEVKQDWTWSTGEDHRKTKEKVEETYQDRLKTKAALLDGELLANVQTSKEKKNISFSQKEKRKRDLGQASRGKNYVEEEKRLLRENGIYSSFDT